jgi:hypothetical protein
MTRAAADMQGARFELAAGVIPHAIASGNVRQACARHNRFALHALASAVEPAY